MKPAAKVTIISGVILGIGVGLYLLLKPKAIVPPVGTTPPAATAAAAATATTSGTISDATNAQLTYLDDWAAGNGSLVAVVTGAAAEGQASITTLYGIAVKFNNNEPDSLTAAETTFWNRMQDQYA